jgi:hypothetical protein
VKGDVVDEIYQLTEKSTHIEGYQNGVKLFVYDFHFVLYKVFLHGV